jgi:hypothetical protein
LIDLVRDRKARLRLTAIGGDVVALLTNDRGDLDETAQQAFFSGDWPGLWNASGQIKAMADRFAMIQTINAPVYMGAMESLKSWDT